MHGFGGSVVRLSCPYREWTQVPFVQFPANTMRYAPEVCALAAEKPSPVRIMALYSTQQTRIEVQTETFAATLNRAR